MQQSILQDIRNGLSVDQIVSNLPSVGKSERWERMSDKYTVISTLDILKAYQEIGYVPTFATQSRSRIEGKEAFTKHYIRLAKKESLGWNLGTEFFEIALINSFDGSSSYLLQQAVTRLACLNGLIVSNPYSTIRVPHKGNIVDSVLSGTLELAQSSGEVMEDISAMKNTQLAKEDQVSLAAQILHERFGEQNIFQPSDLLRVRRRADGEDTSVWTTMNIVQENAIQGGMRRYDARWDKHTARQVKGIDQSLKINQKVWSLAKSYLN